MSLDADFRGLWFVREYGQKPKLVFADAGGQGQEVKKLDLSTKSIESIVSNIYPTAVAVDKDTG